MVDVQADVLRPPHLAILHLFSLYKYKTGDVEA